MRKPALLLALIALATAGCSREPDEGSTNDIADRGSASTVQPPETPVAPASPNSEAPSSTPQPLSVRDLGLTSGVYAASGTTCPPAMASLATFDGSGFGSRNMTRCAFSPQKRAGQTFTGTQTCTDSYSKERVSEDMTITVAGPTRFTQSNKWGERTFDLCPDERLSDWTG
ncbi:hypothetical protein [Croceicoccus sp. BE223]|uniref:hypothetical protein n=1 Tax=Croceicoccus sp. BE223 TaxID=2817716 RepID=UPI0028671533|nr:hypothetical protein [Croceicoccus sp. BE223]MDR7100956.1 hypothetical protein [Croceicoccus sp. BE223]